MEVASGARISKDVGPQASRLVTYIRSTRRELYAKKTTGLILLTLFAKWSLEFGYIKVYFRYS